jgi:hypothetical protein
MVEKKLRELRLEFERGQDQLESIERERQHVRDTLLRISGAIQVLEELAGKEEREIATEAAA